MNEKFFPELTRRLRQAGIATGEMDEDHLPVLLDGQKVMASSQAPYPSPRRKRQGSLIPLLLLSPSNPLRWASMGPPREPSEAGHAGGGGARECSGGCPAGRSPRNGLCPDEVLGGRELGGDWGFEFVTWWRTADRTGVCQGNYYDNNYDGAKLDFACRSGLVDKDRLFSQEQLTEVYRAVHETLDSGYPATAEREDLLKGVGKQIERAIPDLRERVDLSNQEELEAADRGGPGLEMTM